MLKFDPRYNDVLNYHDLKVNTDQNRVGGGQFFTLKFDPILMVYITYRYFKVKADMKSYIQLETAANNLKLIQ